MRPIVYLFFLISPSLIYAQQTFEFDRQFQVNLGNKTLKMPFGGGVNAAQFQEMDVDGDGVEELVLWDINARRVSVFKESNGEFSLLPEMAYYFPADVSGFLILADFNRNGKKDLFTSSPFGIRAYSNVTPSGAKYPQWELAQNFLRLDNGSNVQANNLDIPMIMDIDGDGDLDIVTFNFASGDFLELYRNTSVERKGIPDIDGFAFPEARWGKFEFCHCGSFSFGVTCSGIPMGRLETFPEKERIEHAGGHSILYVDLDGDGILDLLMGQDECSTLYFLPNKGSNSDPVFDEFTTELPGLGQLPEFPVFHTAYLYRDQLLISSNSSTASAQYNSDYSKNIFQYHIGNADPLITEGFLQNEMIDLGENTRVFFKGNNSNGQLVLTANSLKDGQVRGQASLFQVGPEHWTLVDDDFLDLSSLKLTDLQYHEFANSHNQHSYWIAGTDTINFALIKKVYVSKNDKLENREEVIIPVTGIRPMDNFELFTYQGRDYMLLARQTGELTLFDVDFAENITLKLNQRDFLGFSDNPASRNLNVHVIPGQNPALYAIDQRGVLSYINNFMNQNERETVQLSLLDEQSSQSRFGRNSWISHIPKPFGESIDLIIGNTSGGLQYLKSATSGQLPSDKEFLTKVYPNPSNGTFKVIASQAANLRLVSSLGQVVLSDIEIEANRETEIDAHMLAPGLYVLQMINEKGVRESKKVIIKN